MAEKERIYVAIDLKSFYASVECVERGLDPLTTNLVVADKSRTEKTICLAVSPSLKAYGISGRARLFEVVQKVRDINHQRTGRAPNRSLTGTSFDDTELKYNPDLGLDYIVAVPRMAYYIQYSTRIYQIYLKYIAPEDIHVYSIDEVFMDVTGYLDTYGMTAHELTMRMIRDVLKETGITATAGIGSNLYLCKVAMDIVAKHVAPDQDGVRIAELNEQTYREQLWDHRPLTDFWRVGRGYSAKLQANGMYTMGDIARRSLADEDGLYRMFGINAELLIDHAWGWEPCTMADIKAYRPETNSFSSGQVLPCPYEFDKARIVVHEMADAIALDLLDRQLVTDQMVLTVGYDGSSLRGNGLEKHYQGAVTTDYYGRSVPKHAHGTANLGRKTSSAKIITEAILNLYDAIVDPNLLIHRLTITTNRVVPESEASAAEEEPEQLDLFVDAEEEQRRKGQEDAELERERRRQVAVLRMKKKYGKNAILKGLNMEEGATGRSRNDQIGGHKA